VTPLEIIDRALAIAALPDVTFCSFGDMLRVPGSSDDLMGVKSRGGDVRIVYSPLDAVRLAERLPERKVVFFAVGFETTAPANAMALEQAIRLGLDNFSLLVSHVLVPPAIEAILGSPSCRVQGFLAAGHVCAVMGVGEYLPVAARWHVPIVITGFEPLDVLDGIRRTIAQLEAGQAQVENAYTRVVRDDGNPVARVALQRVFEVCDRSWRGIGSIPDSGWRLRHEHRAFDAELRFDVGAIHAVESPLCRSGEVLQGVIAPTECAAFGRECTPRTPLGATMVSDEGTCAAYYTHRRMVVGAG
jgi:hydrogenase expression/formation protein HypD